MDNLQERNLEMDVTMFQVEELEERLENCWNGQEWQDRGRYDIYGVWHENWVQVPCGTPMPEQTT